MSLKKKIALSFFISAFIIALLAAFEYLSFVEIRKEIRYLEITDTVSRKSFQIRRHEKNYFLYSPQKADEESAAVHSYVGELKDILAKNPAIDKADQLSLREKISEYERRFVSIESTTKRLTTSFERVKAADRANEKFISLIEATFLERPSQSADFLIKVFHLPARHSLVTGLRTLDTDISALRKTGEDILVISKDLDKVAREKAETVIRFSQIAILVFFPLFFIVGIGMLFFITTNVVRRLMLLINVVERTGKGSYPHLSVSPVMEGAPDEVGLLIDKFNDMEDQLSLREQELRRKNQELIETRKLAALGTLASGVAHELNNPLNNIYLSAQALARESGEGPTPEAREAVSDILSQTERVKRIVSELLEFARGREPQLQSMDLCGLIRDAYRHTGSSRDLGGIVFSFVAEPASCSVQADPGQLEQVFTNLFVNAADAMSGKGTISVRVDRDGEAVRVLVSDTGRGMPRDVLDKIFEPFFTTKDKGTGLGLAIVYNIIKKHYGNIAVSSEEGTGTTFTITLPVSV